MVVPSLDLRTAKSGNKRATDTVTGIAIGLMFESIRMAADI